jgi:hypothetical protein
MKKKIRITAPMAAVCALLFALASCPGPTDSGGGGTSPAEEAAAAFKIAHSAVLAKTADTVTVADETAVNAALAAYETLGPEAKALAAAEKSLLDDLKAKIDALKAVQGGLTLAAALASISNPANGAEYSFVLEADSPAQTAIAELTYSGSPAVTVTVDGGGKTVTLNNTGSLLAVGSGVTLVLRNITLEGRGMEAGNENNAALVKVNGGGRLELETGAKIRANKNTSSSPHSGGGVSITNGTFTMSGGEISGNASSSGGGVYVFSNGTFTMSDGEISDNTSSPGYGGGVTVASNGIFTMIGGVISGNTSSSLGGGIHVSTRGTFSMSGGARVSSDNPVCLWESETSYSSVTIGGDFTGPSGPVVMIDLFGLESDWLGKGILKLDTGYSSGDLSALRSRFTLGNFVNSSGVATPLTGYEIDTDGTLKAKP